MSYDIIELAREARLGNVLCHNSVEGDRVWIEGADWHDELERFAALLEAKIRADERELLEALEAIMRYPKIREYVGSELANKADAAIAKARGEK